MQKIKMVSLGYPYVQHLFYMPCILNIKCHFPKANQQELPYW